MKINSKQYLGARIVDKFMVPDQDLTIALNSWIVVWNIAKKKISDFATVLIDNWWKEYLFVTSQSKLSTYKLLTKLTSSHCHCLWPCQLAYYAVMTVMRDVLSTTVCCGPTVSYRTLLTTVCAVTLDHPL